MIDGTTTSTELQQNPLSWQETWKQEKARRGFETAQEDDAHWERLVAVYGEAAAIRRTCRPAPSGAVCNRLRVNGSRCSNSIAPWPGISPKDRPQACGHHLTRDEKKAQVEKAKVVARQMGIRAERITYKSTSRRCTFQTSAGMQCYRAALPDWPPALGDDPVRCSLTSHLPGDLTIAQVMAERKKWHAAKKEAPTQWRAGVEYPICWDWLVTSEQHYRVAMIHRQGGPWPLFVEWHDGRCAICGERPETLVEDHDHNTNLVRGLLCGFCNNREGRQQDGISEQYRLRPPAVILGITLEYKRIPAEIADKFTTTRAMTNETQFHW